MKEKTGGLIHLSFEIGLILKGLDGVVEIMGGIIMMFLNTNRLNRAVNFLTRRELSQDPRDFLANYLVTASQHFTLGTQAFGVFYLLSHGIIKIVLILLLWRKKLWSYSLAVAFLVVFILYQVYRYTFTHSFVLILLTIFDLAMIFLTLAEYKRVKTKFNAA